MIQKPIFEEEKGPKSKTSFEEGNSYFSDLFLLYSKLFRCEYIISRLRNDYNEKSTILSYEYVFWQEFTPTDSGEIIENLLFDNLKGCQIDIDSS